MSEETHIHTYEFAYKNKDGTEMWRCADPTCPPKKYRADLVRDKLSKCPSCEHSYVLDRESMRRRRPKCPRCRDTREGKLARTAGKIAGSLLDDILLEEEFPKVPFPGDNPKQEPKPEGKTL